MSKVISILILLLAGTILISCVKGSTECERFESWQKIDESENSQLCYQQRVYLFRGEYYSLYNCCFCEIPSLPRDCNGGVIYNLSGFNMTVFYEEAEYLYSAFEE